jgi:hypothetical protein
MEHLAEHGDAMRRWVTKQLLIRVQTCKQEGMQLRALELLARSAGMFVQTPPVETPAPDVNTLKHELDQHLTMLEDVTPRKRKQRKHGVNEAINTGEDAPTSDVTSVMGEAEASAGCGEMDASGEEGVV